jgi:hypothetical protein
MVYRRVKVNLPAEIRRTGIPEIAVLAPGEEAWVPLELALGDLNGQSSRPCAPLSLPADSC